MTAPGGLPCGRVLADGAPHHCLFDGDEARLLDRPAFAPGARETGVVALPAVSILSPVLPGKVVAVGLNYRAHAAELSMAVQAEPIIFLKPPSAVIGPRESIVLPERAAQVDYEAELVLVVGRRCRAVAPAAAGDYVAGYTCGNDVTARDLQAADGQWTAARASTRSVRWVPGSCAGRRRPTPP